MFSTPRSENGTRGTCHHHSVMARFFAVLFGLMAGQNWAAPYTPTSDDHVLARLSPAEQALGQPAPEHTQAHATKSARALIDEARVNEDARFLGYARATLSPFLDASADASVQLLMAEIEQHQHQFDAARERLTQLLTQRPSEGQAWLMLANLERVQGNFSAARQACQHAATSLPPSSTILCLSSIQAVTGNLSRASQTLNRMATNEALSLNDIEREWLYTLLAEIAMQQGDNTLALRHVQQALGTSPTSPYLRYLQSDIWLMEGMNQKVIADLQAWEDRDNALLRLALAAKRSDHPAATQWRNRYQQRQANTQQSQRPLHHREYARFQLSVLDNPDAALQAARANWSEQRELSDLRILLASAVMSGNEDSQEDAARFIKRHKIEDAPSQYWKERANQ